jgi:hypothetical protein
MLLMVVAGITALVMPLTAVARMEMVTICHVVGPAGAEQHITLEVAAAAVFGPGGHFNDNGTPRAGHDSDYLGPCVEDEDHIDSHSETTSSEEEKTTSTTTADHHHEDPDTDENDVMTSTIDTTPATSDDDEGNSDDGSDTNDESATADPAGEEVAAVVVDSARFGGDTARVAVETLPYTGPSTALILPAVLMLLVGAMVVFGIAGPVPDAGAHVAVDRHRLGLRLRRGRHESIGP